MNRDTGFCRETLNMKLQALSVFVCDLSLHGYVYNWGYQLFINYRENILIDCFYIPESYL